MASGAQSSAVKPLPPLSGGDANCGPYVVDEPISTTTTAIDEKEVSVLKPVDQPPLPPPAINQLRVDFFVRRFIVLTVLTVGLVAATLSVFMSSGLRLSSFLSTDKSEDERKDLLDLYNSRVANIMTAIIKVIDVSLGLLVAVALLCLAARWTLREPNAMVGVMASLAPVVLSFLVCNGPTSVNVQLIPGETHLRLFHEDLVQSRGDGIPVDSHGWLITPWNNNYSETAPKNLVLNTVLRTKFVPFSIVKPRCVFWPRGTDPPNVMVSYTTNDWFVEALPTALEPTQHFQLLPLSADQEPTLSIDVDVARKLFIMTLYQLTERLAPIVNPLNADIATTINASRNAAIAKLTPASSGSDVPTVGNLMDFAGDGFVDGAREMLKGLFTTKTNRVDPAEIRADYQVIPIADSINFTSLTLTIPVRPTLDADVTRTFSTMTACSDEACDPIIGTLFPAGVSGIDPAVRITGFKGSQPNTSQDFDFSRGPLVVLSIARRLTGDEFHANISSTGITVSGLRWTFTVTVGFLSWNLEDLGSTYKAECANLGGCTGLRVTTESLKTLDQFVLIGVSELVQNNLYELKELLDKPFVAAGTYNTPWHTLVKVMSTRELLLPRNFKTWSGDSEAALKSRPSDKCSKGADQNIKIVEKNHMYLEDSLQTGYTAGLHFLLQNAVLHKKLVNPWAPQSYDFNGNYQDVVVLASVPFTNAMLSFGGCGVLIAMALAIAVAHNYSKRVIETSSDSTVIATAMLNEGKFPRTMLGLALDINTPQGPKRVTLKDLEFEKLSFREVAKPVAESSISKKVFVQKSR